MHRGRAGDQGGTLRGRGAKKRLAAARVLARGHERSRLGLPAPHDTQTLPGWLELALWFDLSPVRPWEWSAVDAESWTEAVQLRNAWQDGIQDAKAEAEMTEQLAKIGRPVA